MRSAFFGFGAAPVALGIGLVCLVVPAPAEAKPQWNAGLETALCGLGSSLSISRAAWCNALHADVLLLKQRSSDFGIGPSLRIGTAAFDDVRLDAGLSAWLPVFGEFPLLLEAGPHVRNFDELGLFGSAFFGLRTFNHYGSYSMSTGLVLTVEQSLAAGRPSAWWLALRIDGSWLALPFLLGYESLK